MTPKAELTTRERLVAFLIIWLIQILNPWEYSHEHKEYIEKIKELLK